MPMIFNLNHIRIPKVELSRIRKYLKEFSIILISVSIIKLNYIFLVKNCVLELQNLITI